MYSSFKKCQEQLADVAAVDYFFAKECLNVISTHSKLDENQQEILFHILIKLMNSYSLGHSCEIVANIANKTFFDSKEESLKGYKTPGYNDLVALLDLLDYENLPIYYAKELDSLYIKRLWLYENEIAKFINAKLAIKQFDIQNLKTIVDSLFDQSNETDWQKVAVVNSLIRDFSIISGGPGTGKTTTVTKLLLTKELLEKSPQRIALLAPTGKAAQRLTESVLDSLNNICHSSSYTKNSHAELVSVSQYDINEACDKLNKLEAQTIHRFLGIKPNSKHIKYHKNALAPYDLVVVDEASMLDVEIFIKLIRALGENATLVLVGDLNQLPSVGVGSLLSNLTATSDNKFTPESKEIIDTVTGFTLAQTDDFDYTVKLQKNYRSQQHINDFAKSILKGEFDFDIHKHDLLEFTDLKSLDSNLKAYAKKYKQLEKASNPHEALEEFKKLRILVGNRNIQVGTNQLNAKIERLLGKKVDSLYHAKPIMISQNSHSLGLYNGDIGVLWYDNSGNLKAYFEHLKDKSFAINMLPKFESVYVMTIHKTQGSEFDEVVIVLPDEINKTLTRELLYTGVTRAKFKLKIIANRDILTTIIKREVKRNSNIKELMVRCH